MISRALVGSVVVWLGAAGCHGRGSSHGDQPAPSASVITLGVELGACTDVEACDRECRDGSADRCRRLAASYEFGRGVEKDEAKASTLYELACAMNDPSACVFAGRMQEYGRGVPADPAKATKLYTQACDAHWPAGCYNVAIMYENGRGVPVDMAKAADLYQRACAAGAKTACDKAADLRKPPPTSEPAFLDASVFR
jgi:uncharacterized protein